MDRYFIKRDKRSGILNDPNGWFRQPERPLIFPPYTGQFGLRISPLLKFPTSRVAGFRVNGHSAHAGKRLTNLQKLYATERNREL